MPRLSPVSPASVKEASPEPLLPCAPLSPSVPHSVLKATLQQATTSRSSTSIEKLRVRPGSLLGTSQPPIDRPGRSGARGCPLSNPSKTLKANSALGPWDDVSHLKEAAKEVHHTEHGAARARRPPAAPDRTAEPSSGRHPAPRPMVCPGPPRSPASATRPRRARASPQGLVQTPVPPAH